MSGDPLRLDPPMGVVLAVVRQFYDTNHAGPPLHFETVEGRLRVADPRGVLVVEFNEDGSIRDIAADHRYGDFEPQVVLTDPQRLWLGAGGKLPPARKVASPWRARVDKDGNPISSIRQGYRGGIVAEVIRSGTSTTSKGTYPIYSWLADLADPKESPRASSTLEGLPLTETGSNASEDICFYEADQWLKTHGWTLNDDEP